MAEPLSRKERDDLVIRHDVFARYEATVQQTEERAERLRVALARYGRHDAECRYRSFLECACGLTDALRADDEARGA